MATDLILEEYIHNSLCDVPGCRNLAVKSLCTPGATAGMRINVCEECLQTIVNIVPIETIMNRPDIAEMLQDDEFVPEDSVNGKLPKGNSLDCTTDNVGKALEVETADLSLMKFNELKEMATAKGLKFEVGMSKADLIKYIESN